ncbi:hypothetical protein [Chryseobacterium taiwanense]|uniref:Uncharacterized protein n=1 Tax=Chryseobacterium taiwanense TaxID=363331 RepID=A0A0B4DDX7_9FLAO|nr:hypothetical protein [Chryseobacterium taiwanense]KIC62580.1 hypothetical protein RM51_12005 [Chryseobacterium taiwanense]
MKRILSTITILLFLVSTKLSSQIVKNMNTDLEEFIKTESKEGGKFYFKNIVEKYDGAFVAFDKVLYNKKDFTILMWGAAVNQTGIKDFEKAQLLWEEINHRKLTEPELKALKKGVETKLQ